MGWNQFGKFIDLYKMKGKAEFNQQIFGSVFRRKLFFKSEPKTVANR